MKGERNEESSRKVPAEDFWEAGHGSTGDKIGFHPNVYIIYGQSSDSQSGREGSEEGEADWEEDPDEGSEEEEAEFLKCPSCSAYFTKSHCIGCGWAYCPACRLRYDITRNRFFVMPKILEQGGQNP